MSLHTTTRIQIEGQKDLAETFQSFELHELINGHHRFKLELPGRRFGQGEGEGMGFWRELVGRRIYIEITPADKNLPYASKEFSGLITEVSLGKSHGPQGNIVLQGGSPTLLLDDAPHMAAFAVQTLRQIVEQQLSAYPENLLRPHIDPVTTDPLEYKVQYKENTWQLLQRLSVEYGEWLFYDGQQLVFGRYNPVSVSLTHDKNLDQFSLQMCVRSTNMRLVGYDYSGDRRTTSDTHSHVPTGINIHSRTVLETSQGLFAHPALYKPDDSLNGDVAGRIDRAAARQSASAAGAMVHMEGISRCPSLGMGTHVSVRESLYGKETYGSFMLTEVHHQCNSEGEYRNRFRGVPADVAVPPGCLDSHPGAEAQSAVVIDNDDPEDLGRLRVRFRWQQSGMTPWLRMLSPSGGDGKGFHMIPEKGEEVWVDFAGGHPEMPYVAGTARNASSPSGWGTSENNIKAIRTRSGHTIKLNDTQGGECITIKDKNGNSIRMDTGKKSIAITAPEDMTLNARNLKMNIQEDLTVNVGKSKIERIKENHNLEAKNSTTKILKNKKVRSGEKAEQVSGELTVQTSTGEMILDGSGKVTIQSKDRIDFGE